MEHTIHSWRKDMRETILVTAATGNTGSALLRHLDTRQFAVTAGGRNAKRVRSHIGRDDIDYISFDIMTGKGFDNLEQFDGIFLLRPPQIGQVKKCFPALIETIVKAKVKKLIFLSVQGAGERAYLPHRKIERMIEQAGQSHIFVRPSYFMDNMITTLYDEIRENGRIFMPAGSARFNWINVDDIARAVAILFEAYSTWENAAYTLTTPENMGFADIVSRINTVCGSRLTYQSPNVVRFIRYMRKKGYSIGYIAVLLLLHFVPRFQKEPSISQDLQRIIGRPPTDIDTFVRTHCNRFRGEG